MKTEIQTAPIQETDLELVVSSQTLGSLTTNAIQIRDIVKNALPKYDIVNYNESNVEQAKKDKALLNNAAKALNSKRIELEKEFLKPFGDFKDVISETVKLISECSGKIDLVVKQSDQAEKDSKKVKIQTYWDSKNFTLVPLSKVFDEKWLNKTTKDKAINSEIDSIIENINNELQTLEAIGSDVELLKSLYLDTLDLNKAIQYGNTLKLNKAKVISATPVESTTSVEPISEPVVNTPTTPQEIHIEISPSGTTEELLTRTFKVTCTKDKIIALGAFMNANSIQFEKIES